MVEGAIRRRRAWLAPAAFAVVATISTVLVGHGGSATSPATLFVTAQGSDDAPCTQARPCASFNRAYSLAAGGQVVQVAGGSYGPQTIDPHPSNAGADIVISPAAGATVSATEVVVNGSNVKFAGTGLGTGFVFESWSVRPGARKVTFEQVNTGIFTITSASDISVIGGQVGPWPHGSDSQINSTDDDINPTNILIDGVYFHDVQRATSDDHTECLQIGAGQNVVIRNNRFARCSDHDLYIHPWHTVPGDRLSNFTIENNFFGRTSIGYYVGQFAEGAASCDNFVVRDNVFEQSWVFGCPPSSVSTAPQVFGNYWGDTEAPSACGKVGTWRENIFTQRPAPACDSAQKIVPLGKEMALLRSETVQRFRRAGFRCGVWMTSSSRSAAVCGLRRGSITYRALVVATTSGHVGFVRVGARVPSGIASRASAVLGTVAGIPVADNRKLAERATRFVEKWLGRGRAADGKLGTMRIRVYGAGASWSLLLSPA